MVCSNHLQSIHIHSNPNLFTCKTKTYLHIFAWKTCWRNVVWVWNVLLADPICQHAEFKVEGRSLPNSLPSSSLARICPLWSWTPESRWFQGIGNGGCWNHPPPLPHLGWGWLGYYRSVGGLLGNHRNADPYGMYAYSYIHTLLHIICIILYICYQFCYHVSRIIYVLSHVTKNYTCVNI